MKKVTKATLKNAYPVKIWQHAKVDHDATEYAMANKQITGEGVFIVCLKGVCLYVGEGDCGGTNHRTNRLLCQFNESKWENGHHNYRDLFIDRVPTINERDEVVVMGNKSSLKAVRFFSNPLLRKKLDVFWADEPIKQVRLTLKNRLGNKYKPIYDSLLLDPESYYTSIIKNLL